MAISTKMHYFNALTGGAAGALDAKDGTSLTDGWFAIGFVNAILHAYALDATSGAAEDSPNIIAPDANGGNKRWILQNPGEIYGTSFVDPVWADLLKDGATPPDAAADLTVSNKTWRYRDFDHAQTEDAHFGLIVPPGYGTVKYRVMGAITNATGPSAEGMAFTLAGYCSGDNDPASQTYGSAVTVTKTGLTAIQNDIILTDWSTALTITDIAEYEMANFQFTRDHDHASDDYSQKFGVIAVIIHWRWTV